MMVEQRTAASSSGYTLIELVVCVALVGMAASVAALAARRFTRPDPADPLVIVRNAVDSSLSTGRSITLQLSVDGRAALATFNPDGSVLADSVLRIDRFTGRSTRAR